MQVFEENNFSEISFYLYFDLLQHKQYIFYDTSFIYCGNNGGKCNVQINT